VRKADNLPPSCANVKKSGGLNLLECCGPVQACNGTAFTIFRKIRIPAYHTSSQPKRLTFSNTAVRSSNLALSYSHHTQSILKLPRLGTEYWLMQNIQLERMYSNYVAHEISKEFLAVY
jgi:hypothetical protein